jgi:MFS superfamily sulfate permease-like transporter
MVDLRLMGLMGHTQSISGLARRFVPWVWWSLVVLLLTGLILIAAEPRRDLLNPVFQAKMALILVAIAVTVVFQETVRRNMEFWDLSPRRRAGAWLTAVVSLVVWTAIVGCGRWIAYVDHG